MGKPALGMNQGVVKKETFPGRMPALFFRGVRPQEVSGIKQKVS